tara:strand:- start:75233 stop:76042 length:810 start_codon:yes stop_codon:yes gene_type:complete
MFKNALKISLCLFLLNPTSTFADSISDAVNDEARPLVQRLRDEYRNPQQTLRFFDVQPDMAVAEITPGGGWYTSILAPLLKDNGELYAAHFYIDETSKPYYKKSLESFKEKIKTVPAYEKIKLTAFHPTKSLDFAPAGSLDRVLTFRNAHNWYMSDKQNGLETAFSSFFKALKKGGILGVVDHKMPESFSDELQEDSGYIKQSAIVAAAKKAGFVLAAESDINLNSQDTADYEKGVWTLPPSLRGAEEEQAQYIGIGESSRMTLKFLKP